MIKLNRLITVGYQDRISPQFINTSQADEWWEI